MNRRFFLCALILSLAVGCRPAQPTVSEPEREPPPETETSTPAPTARPTETVASATAPQPGPTATQSPAPGPIAAESPTPGAEIDSGPFERVAVFDFAEPDELYSARLGPGPDVGELWVYARLSAALYQGDQSVIDSVDEEEEIVGVDERGRLWFSARDGTEVAYVAENGAIVRFGAAQGWEPVPGISTALQEPRIDSRGWTWIGTPADLRLLRDDGRWEIITPPDMPVGPGTDERPLASSFSVATIGDQVWVGHCFFAPPGALMDSEGARYYDGETWHETPIRDGCSRDIRQDGAGNIWVGQRDTLWRLDAATGEWSSQPLPEVEEAAFIYLEEFLLGPNGDVWPVAVLCGGASCYGAVNVYHAYSDGALATIAQAQYSGISQWKLFTLPDGGGLLLWDGRLNAIENDRLTPLTDALALDAIQDRDGQVWALTWAGVGLELWRLSAP